MKPDPESVREALERRARVDPEQPFLFFRSPRGTFTWWSFARTVEELRTAPTSAAEEEPIATPRDLLRAIDAATSDELAGAQRLLAAIDRRHEREIWISARPLERSQERLLLLAGAVEGWAVVREPGASLTPALFLWARPTLVSGSEQELAALFDGFGAEAPRRRRYDWLARRLTRLRTVLVESGGSTGEITRALSGFDLADSGPRVLSFPESGW